MDRSNENIKILLDKYWAGESSLEEEKMIYAYFKRGNIEPDLQEFAPLFSYFNSEKETTIDQALFGFRFFQKSFHHLI